MVQSGTRFPSTKYWHSENYCTEGDQKQIKKIEGGRDAPVGYGPVLGLCQIGGVGGAFHKNQVSPKKIRCDSGISSKVRLSCCLVFFLRTRSNRVLYLICTVYK